MVVSLALGPSIVAVGLAVALTALLSLGLGWGVPAVRIGVTLCIITLVTHRTDALEYNALRAANTLIGVVVGLAVSFFVWPVRAHDARERASEDRPRSRGAAARRARRRSARPAAAAACPVRRAWRRREGGARRSRGATAIPGA